MFTFVLVLLPALVAVLVVLRLIVTSLVLVLVDVALALVAVASVPVVRVLLALMSMLAMSMVVVPMVVMPVVMPTAGEVDAVVVALMPVVGRSRAPSGVEPLAHPVRAHERFGLSARQRRQLHHALVRSQRGLGVLKEAVDRAGASPLEAL